MLLGLLFEPEDEGGKLLRIVGKLLLDYRDQHSRRYLFTFVQRCYMQYCMSLPGN
jgi:hypothetical protein